jgi:type IX secretion system substrate protein
MKKILLLLCILAGFTSQAQLVFTNTSAGRFDITFTPDATVKDTDGVSTFTPTDNFGNLFLHMTIVPVNLTPNGTVSYEDEQIMVNTTGLVTLTGDGRGTWTGKLNLNSHQFTSTNNTLPVGTTVSPDFLIQLGTDGGLSAQLTEDLQASAYGLTSTTTVTQTFVNIPDAIFEQVLIMQGIDTEGALDGKILTTDATAVTSLDVSFFAATSNMPSLISDLTGIEGFTELTSLNCSGNKIRNLDLHSNTKLLVLHAEGNGMTTLNIQNGNNATVSVASASNSQVGYWMTGNNLYCVTSDPFAAFSSIALPPPAPPIPTTPQAGFYIDTASSATGTVVRGFSPTSCNDLDVTPFLAGFPAEIITILNAQADANSDGTLLLGEVIAFVGSLDFSTIPGGVSDLSFLDAFTSITGLNLANSTFSSIDLSQYPDLANLDLTGNTNLASLDASSLAALQTLVADGNAALTQLLLSGSANMTDLTTINCPLLGTIDMSDLSQLTTLIATGNALLTSLTLPGQTPPGPKSGIANKITAPNTTLTTVDLHGNGLTGTLDLSNYTSLTTIKVNDNSLTGLNVKNGNNANITMANFDARNNSLTNIVVDDVTYSTTNWTNVDPGVTFTTDATLSVNDNILSTKVSVYPNPTNGHLQINIPTGYQLKQISVYDITGKQVKYSNSESHTLDMGNLSEGFYLLKISTDKGVVTKKVLKY